MLVINGKSISIDFKHLRKLTLIDDSCKTQNQPYATICKIKENNEITLGKSIAKCNPGDSFEYEKGRKLSLKRALKVCEFNTVQRTMIWNLYHNRK